MDTLILDDFRCFAGRHEVPLAPLTVLVGENSSGKSSFLAAVRVAWDLMAGMRVINFNEDPFRLGSFEQIVTSRGHRGGQASSFSVGQRRTAGLRSSARVDEVRVEGEFIQSRTQPYLARHSLIVGAYGLSVTGVPGKAASITLLTPEGSLNLPREELSVPADDLAPVSWIVVLANLALMRFRDVLDEKHGEKTVQIPDNVHEVFREFAEGMKDNFSDARPHAFAPVRSRPQRTYDPITDIPDAEGQHVPMVLAQLMRDGEDDGAFLGQILTDFGRASGLFSGIDVRRFGRGSGPFQIIATMEGTQRNVIDVGYGVSQVLPILVEIATSPTPRTFLIQQPEVHLHPRAQAALATLFGRLVKERRCQLIVETHSDYFIDRLRMNIRDRQDMTPDDVRLLYFELGKTGSTIYPLTLDERGNVLDAPPTYRRFFLDEERRFFGGS